MTGDPLAGIAAKLFSDERTLEAFAGHCYRSHDDSEGVRLCQSCQRLAEAISAVVSGPQSEGGTSPSMTLSETAAVREAVVPPPELHRCCGCGHRWEGPLKGAELCGDCWRAARARRGLPASPASAGTENT